LLPQAQLVLAVAVQVALVEFHLQTVFQAHRALAFLHQSQALQ
jgi:hypothetical protein